MMGADGTFTTFETTAYRGYRRGRLRQRGGGPAVAIALALVAVAGCGGGDDDDASPDLGDLADLGSADDIDVAEDSSAESSGDDDGDGGDFALTADIVDVSSLGPPPTASARAAVVEVDGQMLEFQAIGSYGYICEVTPEQVNVQMHGLNADGLSSGWLSLSAQPTDGGWFGTGALEHADLEHTDLFVDRAEIVVDGTVVTYRGPMIARQDHGQVDPADRLGAVSVDCGDPDFVGTAMIGDETVTVPISGSQQFDCTYADDHFLYRVGGGQYPDTIEMTVDGRVDGDGWIGTATVDTGDDRYVGIVTGTPESSGAGAAGITWTGDTTHTSDTDPALEEQVAVSIDIPCS